MSTPSFPSGQSIGSEKCGGRPLSVLELMVVLEELDRVVCELEESMTEMALPLDGASRRAADAAIAAARRA